MDIVSLDADDHLEFVNEGDLPQFEVIGYGMRSENENSSAIVKIKLKRIFSYHITNTYMPTSTLLILAQATLHFDESQLELAIGLLLTVLLVMYTLYQSICASLTPTAYLKMIDYWLFFCLLMPFFSFLIEVFWMMQKKQRDLIGSTEGWVNDKKEDEHEIKKRKSCFLFFSHGITVTFFMSYLITASLMYNEFL